VIRPNGRPIAKQTTPASGADTSGDTPPNVISAPVT
jgi:hypothetical protein